MKPKDTAAPKQIKIRGPQKFSGLQPARTAWSAYGIAIAAFILIAAALSGEPYYMGLAAIGFMWAGLASAWNIIGGFGGQFSLAHSVFFGAGAYSVALLKVNFGVSPFVGMLVGVVISALIAWALSWALFRLRGPFFAIGTLALSLVALSLVEYFEWTGGVMGVLIPFQDQFITDRNMWAFVFIAFLALCVAVSLAISRSRLGYYLIAVRDDDDAASAAGANPLGVKTIAFVISAMLTSVGGGLFILYLGFLDPPSFMSAISVAAYIPLLALIGGIGTVVGPVIGGLMLPTVQALLRGELAELPPGISEAAMGLILVLAAVYFREGLWGKFMKSIRRFRRDSNRKE
ncbi:MAG: branched-chain amino acid ABC transporter permease [Candidatus Nanopelagicales bacterium]|tara:strand:+ start:1342 stop:2379 length:1038 start_codon:yes stop_codon:yes gene_type:complete